MSKLVHETLGLGIPDHVQSLFKRLRAFAVMQDREPVRAEEVYTDYRTEWLGPSRQSDLVHYETRLPDGPEKQSHHMAMEILAEAPAQDLFSPSRRRRLPCLYSEISANVHGRITEVLEILVDDGNLEADDEGYRFQSNLLRDWWSARLSEHYRPLENRISSKEHRRYAL